MPEPGNACDRDVAAGTTLSVPRYWVCTKCGFRNERRGNSRKCQNPECLSPTGRRKKRVPPHARTLRDDDYASYEAFSAEVHGGEPGACALCGKPKPETSNHERDHGHKRDEFSYGKPRGLLCTYCNKERVGHLSLAEARLVVRYLETVERHYGRERML